MAAGRKRPAAISKIHMANIQDLINLAKTDGGKFFVIDETGEAKLVIMPVEEYQRLLLNKLKKQVEDVEKINRQILEAQLKDDVRAVEQPKAVQKPKHEVLKRLADLREEVIDPSFDFELPKNNTDDF